MKIENIQQNQIQQRPRNIQKKNPNFTGFSPIPLLNFFDTNQAWGANAVDFFCMVLPRTMTDFGRGKDAGIETARREGMGTINDSSVGVYGTLAGLALAMGVNKAYGLGDRDIKASSVFADSETIDMMGEIWHKKLSPETKNPLLEKIKLTLGNYEVFKDGKWEKFAKKDIDKAGEILAREVETHETLADDIAYDIRKILTSSNNLENNFRIIAKEGGREHSSRYGIDSIVENTFKLSKLFTKEKIVEAFENASDASSNAFLKALKSMNLKRSLAGVALASAVGCSVQPINMWLTKRKTGSDSFVGGGKKDDSFKFKMEKLLVGLGFGAGVITTIGNPKNLIKNLQFKGFTPTINQLKFIYGATIISRFLSARNENELKESSIKDMLGYTNWLILGNFVQKLVAQGLDKSLIKQEKTGGILNWITSSSLKTRDEILHSALGEKAFKNGKALSFREMIKALDKGSEAGKKLRILTIAQLAGYAYSGIVLGIGIPKLNIYLTNKRLAKEKKKEQEISEVNRNIVNSKQDDMLNPSNIEFLKEFTGNKFLNS